MAEVQDDRKAHLRARLERGRETFLAAVAALDEADLAKSIWADGGDWTARDLIGHVSYAEGSMLALIRAALAGAPSQADPSFDLDRFNAGRVQRARAQALPDILERLTASHRDALALLDTLTDDDLDRPAYHPVLLETTIEGIFRVIPYHERTHAKDLQKVREAAPPD